MLTSRGRRLQGKGSPGVSPRYSGREAESGEGRLTLLEEAAVPLDNGMSWNQARQPAALVALRHFGAPDS